LDDLAGSSSHPITESWYTETIRLHWTGGDWKWVSFTQADGPVPIPGTQQVSSPGDIGKADKDFGGLRYAPDRLGRLRADLSGLGVLAPLTEMKPPEGSTPRFTRKPQRFYALLLGLLGWQIIALLVRREFGDGEQMRRSSGR